MLIMISCTLANNKAQNRAFVIGTDSSVRSTSRTQSETESRSKLTLDTPPISRSNLKLEHRSTVNSNKHITRQISRHEHAQKDASDLAGTRARIRELECIETVALNRWQHSAAGWFHWVIHSRNVHSRRFQRRHRHYPRRPSVVSTRHDHRFHRRFQGSRRHPDHRDSPRPPRHPDHRPLSAVSPIPTATHPSKPPSNVLT